MSLKDLYDENKEFSDYVDRYARQHHLTVDQTLTLRMVADFAEYIREKVGKKVD